MLRKLTQENRRITEPPSEIVIKRPLARERETLAVKTVLRAIVGQRYVCDANWNGRNVIVKVFSNKIHARRHLKREWRGLSILQARGLNAPKPLFTGQTETGEWAVVTERIANCTTALKVFQEAQDQQAKSDLLWRVCTELAREHNKAVAQMDLHLGNFVLTNNKVFALDAGQMKFYKAPLGRRQSITQLAILICSFGGWDSLPLEKLCQQYARGRGWHFNRWDQRYLQKQLEVQRKRLQRRALKKTMRTSKRHIRIRTTEYLAVFDRDFCQGLEPAEFVGQIDSLMDSGQILKKGNTCYVSRTKWNGKDIVVKRYNHKDFFHSLRHTIKKSRARRSWLNAQLLRMINMEAPAPLAFVERLRTNLLWNSYLVTEYVAGQTLYEFLEDSKVTDRQRSEAAEQVAQVLNRLGENRISHGDLKHSNIIINDTAAVLTDLDAMRAHRFSLPYKIMRIRDIKRIRRNWPDFESLNITR